MLTSTVKEMARDDMFVNAHVRCNGDLECVAKYMRLSMKLVVPMERKVRIGQLLTKAYAEAKLRKETIDFTVSKAERMKLLWHIANKGTDMIYDIEGNEIMASPAVSVGAIKALNDMIAGSLVSKQVDVTVAVEDKRSEQEIADSVKALMVKYEALNMDDDIDDEADAVLPALEHEQ